MHILFSPLPSAFHGSSSEIDTVQFNAKGTPADRMVRTGVHWISFRFFGRVPSDLHTARRASSSQRTTYRVIDPLGDPHGPTPRSPAVSSSVRPVLTDLCTFYDLTSLIILYRYSTGSHSSSHGSSARNLRRPPHFVLASD